MSLKIWSVKWKVEHLTKRILKSEITILKLKKLIKGYKDWIKIDKKKRNKILKDLPPEDWFNVV